GQLDWDLLDREPHAKLRLMVGDLNRMHREVSALHRFDFSWEGFEWGDASDRDQSVIAFIRTAGDPAACVVCVFNFTPVPREAYRIGLPLGGRYRECFNSDAELYGGSNVGNMGMVEAEAHAWQGRDHSVELNLPPLGAVFLQPVESSS
ncbi:MAG: alpha amylase C-terminal domain-containing protein, partial [Verrucomicrobiota bacterium]